MPPNHTPGCPVRVTSGLKRCAMVRKGERPDHMTARAVAEIADAHEEPASAMLAHP